MSRRSVALLCLVACALLLGLLPWTVPSDRLTGIVARQLKRDYGLALAVHGRATLALLPVPRLKLEHVEVSDASGRSDGQVAMLGVELRPGPLALMRVRISELTVAGATAIVRLDGAGPDLAATLLRGLRRGSDAEAGSRIERLVVRGSRLTLVRTDGEGRAEISDLAAAVRWPDPNGDLDIVGSGRWGGEAVSLALSGLNPSRLVSGRSDALSARLSTRLGQAVLTGDLAWRSGPRFSGLITGDTPDIGELTRWAGAGLDFREFGRPLSVGGDGTFGLDGIEWPQATIALGGDRLEGSLAFRFDRDRPQLRATLASESLDLGWLLPIADPMRAEPPHSDYDVRLSASDLRLGPVRLRDAATGILVNGERLEVSLARAGIAGGSVRGRLTASLDGEERDVRAQVIADKLDAAQLFAALGTASVFSGTVGIQAVMDMSGARRLDLSALRGRATVTASDGEIAGLSLGEMPRRQDGPAAARPGRTRFTRAAVGLDFSRGMAEITDGSIDTTATRTQLHGQVSLRDGSVALRTSTQAFGQDAGTRPPVVLDLRGPAGRIAVTAEPTPLARP